jgi:hypothetical protein
MKTKIKLLSLAIGILLSLPLVCLGVVALLPAASDEATLPQFSVQATQENEMYAEQGPILEDGYDSWNDESFDDDFIFTYIAAMMIPLFIYSLIAGAFFIVHIVATVRISDYGGSGAGYFFLGWMYIAGSQKARNWGDRFEKIMAVLLGGLGGGFPLDIYILYILKKKSATIPQGNAAASVWGNQTGNNNNAGNSRYEGVDEKVITSWAGLSGQGNSANPENEGGFSGQMSPENQNMNNPATEVENNAINSSNNNPWAKANQVNSAGGENATNNPDLHIPASPWGAINNNNNNK